MPTLRDDWLAKDFARARADERRQAEHEIADWLSRQEVSGHLVVSWSDSVVRVKYKSPVATIRDGDYRQGTGPAAAGQAAMEAPSGWRVANPEWPRGEGPFLERDDEQGAAESDVVLAWRDDSALPWRLLSEGEGVYAIQARNGGKFSDSEWTWQGVTIPEPVLRKLADLSTTCSRATETINRQAREWTEQHNRALAVERAHTEAHGLARYWERRARIAESALPPTHRAEAVALAGAPPGNMGDWCRAGLTGGDRRDPRADCSVAFARALENYFPGADDEAGEKDPPGPAAIIRRQVEEEIADWLCGHTVSGWPTLRRQILAGDYLPGRVRAPNFLAIAEEVAGPGRNRARASWEIAASIGDRVEQGMRRFALDDFVPGVAERAGGGEQDEAEEPPAVCEPLKACPFCEASAIAAPRLGGFIFATCGSCGANGAHHSTWLAARSAWNTRLIEDRGG